MEKTTIFYILVFKLFDKKDCFRPTRQLRLQQS